VTISSKLFSYFNKYYSVVFVLLWAILADAKLPTSTESGSNTYPIRTKHNSLKSLNLHFIAYNRYRRRSAIFRGAEHNVSFVEFVRFLTDRGLDDSRRFNAHWAPVSDLCRPCLVHFDYVIKLKEFDTEAFQLWKALYGDEPSVLPTMIHRNAQAVRTTYDVTGRYLRQLTRRQVRRLVRLYADDFRLFDYSSDIYRIA